MTQIVRPSSDISAGGWTASGGGSLYAAVDEAVADDSDFIASGESPSADVCEFKFGDPGTVQAVTTGHVLRYRVVSNSTGTLTVTLLCGSTTVATWVDDWTAGDKTHTLTSGEVALISDYANLRVRFSATAGAVVVPPTYTPPSWATLPAFTFAQGVAGSQSFAAYFTEGNDGTSTITGANLPAGVAVNSALRTLVYDGVGAVGSSSTCTLTSDDGHVDSEDLTTLVIRDTAGTAGMVFKEGDVPSTSHITSDLAGFQASIKNYWPDGSAKIAVLSWSGATASQASPATISIRSTLGPDPGGTALSLTRLRSVIAPTGSVAFGSYGTVDLATTISTSPFRTWQSGPRCSEWHWRAQVGSDPTLVCWVYVRLYANDRVWVRVIAENGYLYVTPQTGKAYRAVVTLNGSTVYDSVSSPTHYSRARWSLEFWYDGGTVRAPGHDGAYVKATKLVPNYGYTPVSQNVYDGTGSDITGAWWDPQAPVPTAPVTTATPFGRANQRPDMSVGGYAYSIGILPLWDVLYLQATQGSANQEKMFQCSVANATAHGAFRVDYMGFCRDESTYLPPKFSTWPNLWAQAITTSGGQGIGSYSDSAPYRYEDAHSPSFAFATYIWTGDYFYVETMQMQATWNWAYLPPYDRDYADGVCWKWSVQPRQWAWIMRTLAQTICITPDDDTTGLRAEYKNSLSKNIKRQLEVYVDGNYSDPAFRRQNVLGVIGWPEWDNYIEYGSYTGNAAFTNSAYRGFAPWMFNFCGGVLGYMDDLKVLSGADLNEQQRLMRFSLSHVVGLLGDNAGFPYTMGGVYKLPYAGTYASRGFPSSWSQLWDWFRLAEPATPNLKAGSGPVAGAALVDTSGIYSGSEPALMNGYVDTASIGISTWANMMPAISYAKDKGITGVAAAWARLTAASNWTSNAYQFNDHPLWGVKPR